MGKSFTQFLLGAVAALLLALPVQAGPKDPLSRKAPGIYPAKNMLTEKYTKGHNAAEAALLSLEANKETRLTSLQKLILEKERENAWIKGNAPWSPAQIGKKYQRSNYGQVVEAPELGRQVTLATNHAAKSPMREIESEEVVDENGIIITPDKGEHVTYYRTGDNLYANESNQVQMGSQDGQIEVVVTGDGVYYFQDLVSTFIAETWVKGTRNGNIITVRAGQPVYYSSNYNTTLSIKMGSYVEGTGFGIEEGDITLTVDDENGTITLNNSGDILNGGLYAGVFWDDDNSFVGNGDYNTVYTLEAPETPGELVTLPEGVEAEEWYLTGSEYGGQSVGVVDLDRTVQVAVVGDEIYVSGISKYMPNGWIKGTISGTTATFPVTYLGTLAGYDLFFTGVGQEGEGEEVTYVLAPVVMTWDPVAQMLTYEGDILINDGSEQIGYFEYYFDIVISKNQGEEPAIETGDPVEVPYFNNMDTEEQQAELGISDANKDNKTWAFATDTEGYRACYTYDSNNNANDWLVTPAVKLEAGTTYSFAIDAYAASANYPERLEVKMSTEAKASTLAEGITVIEATDIDFDAAQTLSAKVTVEETGYYHFGIHAISDANNFRLYVDNISIDLAADTNAPAAVTDLSVAQSDEKLAGIVTFTAPTTTVGGEPLTSNLTKVELYRDGKLIATFEDVAPGAVITYVDEADDLTIGTHSYYVLAYNEAGYGKKSDDVKIFLSEILNVPYYADLSSQDEFANFQVVDANGDGRTWQWSESNGTFYRYSGMNDGDDYLVTMPVKLQAGKNYNIVVNAAAYSASYPERFEVVLGLEPTPEAMTITAIEPTDVTTNVAEDYEGLVSIKQSGNYYVAIHAISDADQYYLLVNSLAIEVGAEGTAPRAVTDLTVESASQGFMAANVSFVAPTLNVNGQPLSGTMTIEVVRDGKVIATMENVAPGTPVQFLDELSDEQPGLFTYQVFVYNNSGKGLKSEKVTEYIGTDLPLAPTNLAAEDKGIDGVLVTWDKVGSVGQNDGYVDVSKVKYSVYDAWFESFLDIITYPVVGDYLYGSGYDINSIMARLDPDQGEQDYTYFAVTTANEYTPEGYEDYDLTGLLTGRPYDLPLFEGFANNQLHYFWESNANLYISTNATDGDGVALNLCTDEPGLVYFESGKLNLANTTNPTLFFDVKSNTLPLVTVRAKIDGQPASFIDNAGLNPEFKTVKVPLTALKDSRYAQVSIEAQMNKALEIAEDEEGNQQIVAGDSLIIDNIMIVDLKQKDMAVALTTPQTVTAGKSAQMLITVTNQGEVPAKNYTVYLYKGSEVIYQETVSEELGFYQSKTFTTKFDTDVFTPAGNVILTAYVAYSGDEDLSNNRANSVINVVAPTDATPADLAAEQGEGTTVNVSWTAPAITTAEATEQFDDQATFAEFSIAGITAEQNTGTLGDWTVYDGNGLSVYGFNGITVPNLGGPMGWMVFTPGSDQLATDLSENYAPHSGTQFMASFCVAESATSASSIDATDHWLISPMLPGTAQTIKFFARALTASYGAETFEVLVSTSDADIANFTKVGDGTCAETEWTEFSFNLPEGATYFAIRHTSQDVFALFVDDITFTTGGAAPASYNVYVDGQLVTNTTDTSAQLTLTPGNHQVSVTAVYANGNESVPVNYWINVADPDAIEQILATGKKVDVYSVDGRLLRQQVSTLKDLTPGVYVIEDRKVIVK